MPNHHCAITVACLVGLKLIDEAKLLLRVKILKADRELIYAE